MTKEKYLEKLSKMDGEKLVEELLYRDYLLTQEEKSSDEYTERYFKLKYMYNTCKDYIADKINKEKQERTKELRKEETETTNLEQLQNVCKEVNEKMDTVNEDELKEIVNGYYKDDVISFLQWNFLLEYIERKEKISDSFAFMYSE